MRIVSNPPTPVQQRAPTEIPVSSTSKANHKGMSLRSGDNPQSTAAFCASETIAKASLTTVPSKTFEAASKQFLRTHTTALSALQTTFFDFIDTTTLIKLTDEFGKKFEIAFKTASAEQAIELSESDALKSAGQTAKEAVTKLFMASGRDHKNYAGLMALFEQTVNEKTSSQGGPLFRHIRYLPVAGLTYASMKAAVTELPAMPTTPLTEAPQSGKKTDAPEVALISEPVAKSSAKAFPANANTPQSTIEALKPIVTLEAPMPTTSRETTSARVLPSIMGTQKSGRSIKSALKNLVNRMLGRKKSFNPGKAQLGRGKGVEENLKLLSAWRIPTDKRRY